MTKAEIGAILDRVRTWPEERQQDAAAMLLLLEENGTEVYVLSEDETRDLEEAEAEIARGEVASEAEVEAVFARFRSR